MNEETKQLLIDCANFIQPYDDGGNEAERLMERLDKALEEGQSLPIDSVSVSLLKKYMSHVEECEGLDFVKSIGCTEQVFTANEIDLLTKLSKENNQ